MRISFVLSSLRLSGGVNVVVEYANRLSERGYTITLVVPGGTVDSNVADSLNPDVNLVESKAILPPTRNYYHLLRVVLSLITTIPKSDIVVATHTPTVLPAILASYLKSRGNRVWFYQDYQEMFADRLPEKIFLRLAPKWFRHVAVVSKAGQEDIRALSQIKATIVSEGLSQPELLFGQPKDLNGKIKRIMYVGDDRPRKGLAEFLEASKLVQAVIPDIRLVIVSKKPCDIQTEVPFDFHLYPSREQLGELYRSSHLFVSTSWAEGFGLPPLEAMASGTPVVLTNSRGVLDYAQPGENCLMVPPREPQSMSLAIIEVLRDDALALRFRTNGPKTAQMFNWDKATEQFERIFQNVVSSHRS